MSWSNILSSEKTKPYFQTIQQRVAEERKQHIVYPRDPDVFNAFRHTSFESLSIVILGQDPYHGPNQAHGLSFSVPDGTPPPPSLKNIFKELNQSLDIPIPNHGNLTQWAHQGVLLLNTVLTVRSGQAQSHANLGWQTFTDHVIKQISTHKDNLLFLLWGRHAQQKQSLIDHNKHTCLTAPHPSPLSAHRGFLGCQHFYFAQEWLQNHNLPEIDWNLTHRSERIKVENET